MRTVFDNDMCAHVWAQQSQAFGRSKSMHFDGAVIYSYQTPIAAFAPTRKGELGGVALISAETYSLTTASRHLPAVRQAVRGTYLTVADIGHEGGRRRTARTGPASDPASWKPVHAANLKAMAEGYAADVARFMRMQSWYWVDENDVRQTLRVDYVSRIENYADRFKVPERERPKLTVDADAARIWARCVRLTAERAKPGRAEKAEKARLARQALAEKKRAEANRLAALSNAERLAEWQAGGSVYLYWRRDPETDTAWLRVKGAVVETSLGASAPLADVRRVLDVADHIRASAPDGEGWERPDGDRARYQLGHFTLDRVGPKGVRCGCHFISWAELDRVRPAIMAEG